MKHLLVLFLLSAMAISTVAQTKNWAVDGGENRNQFITIEIGFYPYTFK